VKPELSEGISHLSLGQKLSSSMAQRSRHLGPRLCKTSHRPGDAFAPRLAN